MRVAVAQFSATMDKAANFERISALVAEAAAAGARLVVLPEAAMCDFGEATSDIRTPAENLEGPFVEGLGRLAAGHGLTVVAGMFERIPDGPRIHNAAVAVGTDGAVAAVHRKHHLFDAFGEKESERVAPGEGDPPLFDVGGFRAAVVTCYDIRFASYVERAADAGADLLVVCSAWVAGPGKEAQWDLLVRARALDSTVFVAAAGQTGPMYCGRSAIVDPLGILLAGAGEAPGIAVADISPARLGEARARLPILTQRRPAVAALD